METAPLTLAHTHARNAGLETKRSNPVAASEEHDLAAAEFAAAAQSTTDLEALRILNLLEQHHKKLGQLLKISHEKPPVESTSTSSSPPPPASSSSPGSKTAKQESTTTLPGESTTQPPRLIRPNRSDARDLTSSIASNLASARGIPNSRQKKPLPISPLVSNQHADGHFAQDDTKRTSISRQSSDASEALGSPTTSRYQSSRPTWAPPVKEVGPEDKDNTEVQSTDAPFQQFYTTFESLISKLSAPLAFAGLPLSSNTPTPAPKAPIHPTPPSPKVTRPSKLNSPSQSVEYSQLISKAALRAVQSNSPGGFSKPSESFYVVPTTGGTISYAEIMNRAERGDTRSLRHHRQTSNLSNISEDDFVDAKSTILPERAGGSLRGRRGEEYKVNGKTMEELALENEALKHLSDTLAKRLHVFEMSAQTSSAALAQSIRSMQRSPLTTPENSRGRGSQKISDADNEGMAKRISELEEILRKSDSRAKKKDEENAKLRETILRYKEKWENLKAGAKARREGQARDKSHRKDDGSSKTDDTGDQASTAVSAD